MELLQESRGFGPGGANTMTFVPRDPRGTMPLGFYIDDFQVTTAEGTYGYFTSFEIPEPSMVGLLAAASLLLFRRRR